MKFDWMGLGYGLAGAGVISKDEKGQLRTTPTSAYARSGSEQWPGFVLFLKFELDSQLHHLSEVGQVSYLCNSDRLKRRSINI